MVFALILEERNIDPEESLGQTIKYFGDLLASYPGCAGTVTEGPGMASLSPQRGRGKPYATCRGRKYKKRKIKILFGKKEGKSKQGLSYVSKANDSKSC